MPEQNCAVILAAGEGKRMKANRPKVLSPVLFKPMLEWVMDSAHAAGVKDLCVVAGYMHERVEQFLARDNGANAGSIPVAHVLQAERKGTGHAVMMADAFLREHSGGNVLILNGDAPFVGPDVISDALEEHCKSGNSVTVVTAELEDATGYGRIVRDPQTHLVSAIVEHKDADEETRKIREINSGAYWFRVDDLLDILYQIKNDNVQGEYYLTDAVKLMISRGKPAAAFTSSDTSAVLGANDCLQLNELNTIARDRVLNRHMAAGVEIPCCNGVIIGPDVVVGNDTCILPGTVLRGKTSVGNYCTLGPNTMLTDCNVGDHTTLNCVLGEGCTVPSGSSVAPFTVLQRQ